MGWWMGGWVGGLYYLDLSFLHSGDDELLHLRKGDLQAGEEGVEVGHFDRVVDA